MLLLVLLRLDITGMPLKLKETNLSTKYDRLKNPNWREADQLASYVQEWLRSWTGVYRETTLAERGETSTRDLRISSPALWPLDHAALLIEEKMALQHDLAFALHTNF